MAEMKIPKGYKKTEVGVIPEDWEMYQLGVAATLERGKFSARPRNDPKYFNGEYPFIQTGDVTNTNGLIRGYSQSLNEAGLKVSKLFPKGTLFFTIAANIGDVAFAEFDSACPDSLIGITTSSAVEPFWLYHTLKSKKSTFEGMATQNAQLNINLEKLRPYLLALPPLPEQRAIATALSDVDSLIAGLDKLIAKKRDLKQAAMQQLLTGQKRLPGFQGEWEEKNLKDLGEFKNGINKNAEDFGCGSPFVNLLDVFGVPAISNNVGFGLVMSSENEKATYDLKRGDVVFIRSSVKPSGVGLTAVIENDLPDTVYSGFLIRFRDRKNLDIGFKKHCFYEEGFRRRLISSSSVSANTNINQDNLGLLTISVPPTSAEQTAIATILSDMDTELTTLEQRRDKTRALKQGMMLELLTGKTRLI